MARLVKKYDKEPKELRIGIESRWICMCGLSKVQPLCDGTHKITQDEEPGLTYIYDEDGERTEVRF